MSGELSDKPISLTVEARAHGWRVDHYLSRLYPNYSRALFQKAIEQEAVLVNGLAVKMSRRLRVNDVISVRLPTLPDQTLPADDIPLEIVFEDEHLVVINKPAGLITHPGKGNYRGTLAGALQFHFDHLSDVAGELRPGIVHRLDRDTSGLLVVAKDNQVHHKLSGQFERREVMKEYRALTWGVIERDSDYIETYLRVHPKTREKMMVCEPEGNARHATTFYEVLERFWDFTYVKLLPKTGRTHQLRVHLRHIHHAILADELYGGRSEVRRHDIDPDLAQSAKSSGKKKSKAETDNPADEILISRQALHAHRLEFRHPATDKAMSFEAPLPADMQATLEALRKTAKPSAS